MLVSERRGYPRWRVVLLKVRASHWKKEIEWERKNEKAGVEEYAFSLEEVSTRAVETVEGLRSREKEGGKEKAKRA